MGLMGMAFKADWAEAMPLGLAAAPGSEENDFLNTTLQFLIVGVSAELLWTNRWAFVKQFRGF